MTLYKGPPTRFQAGFRGRVQVRPTDPEGLPNIDRSQGIRPRNFDQRREALLAHLGRFGVAPGVVDKGCPSGFPRGQASSVQGRPTGAGAFTIRLGGRP